MELRTKSRLRPMGQRVIIIPIPDSENISGSKIIKPDSAQTKSTVGRIVAIGDGMQDTTFVGTWPPVSVGELVLYGRFAGHEIAVEDAPEKEWPRILGIDEILAVVEK